MPTYVPVPAPVLEVKVKPQTTSMHRYDIEVEGSHCGLGHNPTVLYAIADRLAQPEGQWKPFDRSGLRSLIYPDPRRGDPQVLAR
mgnify:CR=1 FL=1